MNIKEFAEMSDELEMVPVIHAKWIRGCANEEYGYCSRCKSVPVDLCKPHNYCPNCGAKMDKEKDK